ncbi:M20 family metallo-hydrolase [Virgibacillus sp. W0181]|uniref:M20 family metallo-hydrolase n=1 Tax=Virgibacillus sp. W0181 TaxID=3391581 RepID=UPI003F47F58B
MTQFSLQEKLLSNYATEYNYNGVSGERLAQRLGELSKIGLTADHGSNRPGFSEEEQQAKELVQQWMKEAGLKVWQDGAGNVFGRLEGKNKEAKTIISGSHVDSVPNGGHFDGPLGVLSALEVVEAWRETGYEPDKPFEVAIFTDEEGSRFNGGFHGSEAVVGKGDIQEKLKLKDSSGSSFEEVLNQIGLSIESYEAAVRNFEDIELFIELHIEQGKRLEKAGLPCGIVSGIAGPSWTEFTFYGQAGHAGNTPMNDRQDALVAASEFILEVNKLAPKVSDSAVATVGKQFIKPNGVNVIPGEVKLYVDIRDIFKETRDALIEKVTTAAQKIAEKNSVHVESYESMRTSPVPIEENTQHKLEEAFKANNINSYKLPSGAGHDSMIIAEKAPVAMLFVQSKDGISHNPAEWSDLSDCVQGVHVLKTFIEKMQS